MIPPDVGLTNDAQAHRDSPDTVGLTDADRQALADMAVNGVRAYARNGGGDGPDPEPKGVPVTCAHCGHAWRYTGRRNRATCSQCGYNTNVNGTDHRGLSESMCAAIREAARDGLSYRQIAETFTFISTGGTAYRHAVGECEHGGPGVPPAREPGPTNRVSEAECASMRDRLAAGESQYAIAKAVGRHQKTVWFHVSGACSHDRNGYRGLTD